MPTTTAARILSLIAYRAFRFHVWRICRTTWSFLTTTMVMTMWWTEADIAAVAVVVSLRPLMQRRWHSLADLMICRPQLPTSRAFLNSFVARTPSAKRAVAKTMFVSVKKMRVAAKKTRASVKRMHDFGKRLLVNGKKLHANAKKPQQRELLSAPLLARHAMLNEQRALKLDWMLLTWTRPTLRMQPKRPRSHWSVSNRVAIVVKAIAAKVMAKPVAAGADVGVVVVDAVAIVMTKHQPTETVAGIVKADAMLRATTRLVRQPSRALKVIQAAKAPKAAKLLKARHVVMAAKAMKAERTDRASVVVDVVAAVVDAVVIGAKAQRAQRAHLRVTAVQPQQVMRRNLALEANHWAYLRDQAAGAPRVNHVLHANHVSHAATVARANRAATVGRANRANRVATAPRAMTHQPHRRNRRPHLQQPPPQIRHWAPQRRPFEASPVGCDD
jgi:hypothetical protein